MTYRSLPLLIAYTAFLLPLSAGYAFALDAKKLKQNSSLSQLEFDKNHPPAKPIEVNAEQVKAIIPDGGNIATPETRARLATPVSVSLSPAKQETKKSSLRPAARPISVTEVQFDDETKRSGYGSITPRIKGPEADAKNAVAVTSAKSWPHPKQGGCAAVFSPQDRLAKGRALRDVLGRFTGNDDYFESLNSRFCTQHCAASTQVSMLIGVGTVTSVETKFAILEDGAECRYKIVKPEAGVWMLIRTEKAVCACVPK